MGKQRMSALDLRTVVAECRESLLGLRLANVYDRASPPAVPPATAPVIALFTSLNF